MCQLRMDLPCFCLCMSRGRGQQHHSGKPLVWERQKSGKKLPGIHVLCMCAPFVVPLIQIFSVPSAVFLLPLPAILILKVHDWAIGLVAQRGIHGAHISRASWSAERSMAGFSPGPFKQCFKAAKQLSRAVASNKAVLAQPGNLWPFLNKGLVA